MGFLVLLICAAKASITAVKVLAAATIKLVDRLDFGVIEPRGATFGRETPRDFHQLFAHRLFYLDVLLEWILLLLLLDLLQDVDL